jgi:HPt (histidine-containing phosphotransfer) domain-containing protein
MTKLGSAQHTASTDNGQTVTSGRAPRPIDSEAIARLRALDRPGRPSLFAKILTQYLATAAEGMDKLRDAIRTQDATVLHQTAHRFKSSSAQVGALSMAASCQELELLGRTQSLEGADQVFERLKAEYREATHILTSELAATKGDQP